MAKHPQLVDQYNRPIQRSTLREEVSAPTIGGVRSPISGYPADGLNPLRLAQILREADQGDPLRFLELAETIEERDSHYLGVLSTRKRSVSQIEITVEPGDDSAQAERHADMVRTWLKRDELTDELFDILDAIGKGFSFTEIIWDTSMGQWMPDRLEWRDPRWFRFARHDLATPLMLDDNGQEKPLLGFKFISARMKAKSGLPLRSGIARVAMWTYMFKKFTERDWAIFTQTYGQPLRVGKYGAGASKEDRDKLFMAVANIAGDCAAIVPESMVIEFVETSNVGASTNLYKERADWLDMQTSKLVLGQTATTDAVTGGLGSGKEHRQVQEDIERADARAISAILNRDLIRPWVDLEYGPQKVYPRLIMARPEQEDLASFSSAITPLINVGLRVAEREVLAKFGLSEPSAADRILGYSTTEPPSDTVNGADDTVGGEPGSKIKYQSAPIKYLEENSGGKPALNAQEPSGGRTGGRAPEDILADRLEVEAGPAMGDMIGQIEAMLAASGSFEEFADMLRAGFGDLNAEDLAGIMAMAMTGAELGGIAAIEDDAGG